VLFNCYISDLETCFKLIPPTLYLDLDIREQGFGMEAEVTGEAAAPGRAAVRGVDSYKAPQPRGGQEATARDGVKALWILGRQRFSRPPKR